MPIEVISGESIKKLWSKLVSIRQNRQKELDEINDILFNDPLELARYYVEPDCQERNPADRHEEDEFVVKMPVMKQINIFLQTKTFEYGGKQLFFLSDAGMGKTALLAMLKLMHMTAFLPQSKNCVLKKLGVKTIEEIQSLSNKRETILLLDSLDEDQTAYGRPKERILEILDATKNFFRVIITCRTQFFPKIEEDVLERVGKVSIEGFNCPVKYLSFFSDQKVDEYLEKRFPKQIFGLMQNPKKMNAKEVIRKMGPLRCRPMLLAYIEDLMNSPLIGKNDSEFKIYDALVKSWLNREQVKSKIPDKDILDACVILATFMQEKNIRRLTEKTLDELISQIAEVKPVKHIDIKGRSLLNRSSEGEFRFSHYSIQEFLVSYLLLEKPIYKPKNKIHITDFMLRMIAHSGKPPRFIELLDFKDAFIENDLGMRFVYIFPGEFIRENYNVILTKGFFMQTTPVTQAQWVKLMGNNPSKFKNCQTCPVETVSWNDTQQFIKRLNQKDTCGKYRLPTEAEWEYACRAGSQTEYCFGDDEGMLGEYAWYQKNSDKKTHPVGQLKPNAWGLYDMHGNVWEWCQDWYGEYPSGTVTDPEGPSTGSPRVSRGGSWDGDAAYCRSASRLDWYAPSYRYSSLGFRLVLPGQQNQ